MSDVSALMQRGLSAAVITSILLAGQGSVQASDRVQRVASSCEYSEGTEELLGRLGENNLQIKHKLNVLSRDSDSTPVSDSQPESLSDLVAIPLRSSGYVGITALTSNEVLMLVGNLCSRMAGDATVSYNRDAESNLIGISVESSEAIDRSFVVTFLPNDSDGSAPISLNQLITELDRNFF